MDAKEIHEQQDVKQISKLRKRQQNLKLKTGGKNVTLILICMINNNI